MIPGSKVRHPADSFVQSQIEKIMLKDVQERHPGWQWVDWKTIAIELGLQPVWQKAKPDAAWRNSDGNLIIAECYARVGKLKPGHRRKLALDTLKLLSLRNAAPDPNRLHLLLIVPEEIEKQLLPDSWLSVAIRRMVDVVTVRLSDDDLLKLGEATNLQGAGQARI